MINHPSPPSTKINWHVQEHYNLYNAHGRCVSVRCKVILFLFLLYDSYRSLSSFDNNKLDDDIVCRDGRWELKCPLAGAGHVQGNTTYRSAASYLAFRDFGISNGVYTIFFASDAKPN